MSKQEIIYQYEQLLMGNMMERDFKKILCSSGLPREDVIGLIWNHAITNLLHWSAHEAKKNLTQDIVRALKLNCTINTVAHARDLTVNNYNFILQFAFPDEISYSFVQETLEEYRRYAKEGVYAHDTNNTRKPKGFFVGSAGQARAKICFSFVVSRYLSHMTVPEQYAFFGCTAKAKKWMKEHSLDTILTLYYNDPLDCFHNLGFSRNRPELADVYYYEYKGENLVEAIKKEEKKKGKKETKR